MPGSASHFLSLAAKEQPTLPSHDSVAHMSFKADEGKLRWDLMPFAPLEHIVKILMHGASKYGENTWQQVESAETRYFAAVMRHLVAWRKGEVLDSESRLPHLAHAACSLLFLLYFEEQHYKGL